ncbi:MAG: DUF896 domain-containing protein [Pelosinus sp.]|nr:DUF896 domain-containing protein [Pelosinus sp.]
MVTPEVIERINVLAKKQRETGLSPDEKTEQAKLRRIFIDNIKDQVSIQLEATKEHAEDCSCGCHHEH